MIHITFLMNPEFDRSIGLRVCSLPVLAPKVANMIKPPQIENSHLLEARCGPPVPPPLFEERGQWNP